MIIHFPLITQTSCNWNSGWAVSSDWRQRFSKICFTDALGSHLASSLSSDLAFTLTAAFKSACITAPHPEAQWNVSPTRLPRHPHFEHIWEVYAALTWTTLDYRWDATISMAKAIKPLTQPLNLRLVFFPKFLLWKFFVKSSQTIVSALSTTRLTAVKTIVLTLAWCFFLRLLTFHLYPVCLMILLAFLGFLCSTFPQTALILLRLWYFFFK